MPEIIGLVVTLFIVLLIIYRLQRKQTGNDDVVVLDLDLDWLQDRWRIADAAEASGCDGMFHTWYFDPPTEC